MDRLQKRILVNTVMNLGVSLKAENFLTSRKTVVFSRTSRHVFYLVSSRRIGENCILKDSEKILYMWCRRRYICGAADECFVLFRIGVRVTIRLPVGQSVSQSVHPSWCLASPGTRDKISVYWKRLSYCLGTPSHIYESYLYILGREIDPGQ